jgi:RHS repeat-associated protein
MVCSGSLPEQNLTTAWQYEPRGFITGYTEQFASTNTGPSTSVQRSYYPYGILSSESVSAGSFSYGTKQHFDAAGRRSELTIGSGSYGFGWRADGSLFSSSDSTGSGSYGYDTAGLLTNRLVGNRYTSISSRDGEGRPLSIATTVNTLTELTESLTWSGDGLLASHTLARADFTDSRAYAYANLSRRLTQEQLNLNAGTTWTNTLTYDNGVAAGPGVLTQMGQANSTSNEWSGVADAFSRVSSETNNTFQYAAYGHVNGQSTLSAWLDSQPVPITGVGTNAMQWRAMMELSPGTHQLKVAAAHPSGFYTAWATNSFTNSIAYQATVDSYDSAGNITNRVWRSPNGTVDRTQTLSWDARERLHSVTERDASNSGYNWTATYDGLNRRLSTTSILVTNGVAFTSPPTTINSYYDPQLEFLELGVSYGLTTEWKLYGPDLNGRYGGLNGTGGFDAVSPYLSLFDPTISDFRGNIIGVVTNGVISWNPSRPTGYGAVPDYRPVALANGADIAQSSAWRGHWVDITGFYNVGARTYDPIAGNWLSFDPIWNDIDPNGYTFCGGDSVNSFDSNGRLDPNAPYEADLEQNADFQNELYQGNPAAVQAMQQNGGMETYYNGDATAYLQGQNDRAAETAAVVIPTMAVASVVSLPAGPEGEAITWNVIGGAILRGAVVNGAASSTIAYETGEPVAPAFAGGFVAGAVTGPVAPYAQTLSPFASIAVNSIAGFVGNYAGSTVSQISANGNFDSNQSLFAGIFGAALNPAEANVSATAEGLFPGTVTQTSLFKAGQLSLDYGIGVGDSSFEYSLEPTSQNNENQQGAGAYTPGPLGGKH